MHPILPPIAVRSRRSPMLDQPFDLLSRLQPSIASRSKIKSQGYWFRSRQQLNDR
jgi:hypothetical protein